MNDAYKNFHVFFKHYEPLFENYQRYGETTIGVDLNNEEDVKEIFLKSPSLSEFKSNMEAYWLEKYQFIIKHFSDIKLVYGYTTTIPATTYVSGSSVLSYPVMISKDLYDYLWEHAIHYECYDHGVACVEVEGIFYLVSVYNTEERHNIFIHREKFNHDSIIKATGTT